VALADLIVPAPEGLMDGANAITLIAIKPYITRATGTFYLQAQEAPD